jgi:hypothetical protein
MRGIWDGTLGYIGMFYPVNKSTHVHASLDGWSHLPPLSAMGSNGIDLATKGLKFRAIGVHVQDVIGSRPTPRAVAADPVALLIT